MLKHIRQTKGWEEKTLAEQGFTLIELLVVIAILGILAVVGVLAFGGLTDSAKTATNKTELAEIQTAADAYVAKGLPEANLTGAADTPALVAALKAGNVLKPTAVIKCTYTVTAGPEVAQGTCPA